MNIDAPLQLLDGLSPRAFMRRHWHKKPLVIRQAIPGFRPPLDRSALFKLAAQDDVQSRLVERGAECDSSDWTLRNGPFGRRALPPLSRAGWTLLIQGVDLLDDQVHALMNQFRFVPDARLDDVMISYATDAGGVGPHFDSYDVFLLQAHGQRRWRIGRQKDLSLLSDLPLKILAHFAPEMEFVLEPGDMLYLPPRYAHDGIALGECMTYSIGFRSPASAGLASEMLQRLAQDAIEATSDRLYRDSGQDATDRCGRIPATLVEFTRNAVHDVLQDPLALGRVLGEYLSEPKAHVVFDSAACQLPSKVR
jgi:50S ribosomal protein L16 3-hydroxylase